MKISDWEILRINDVCEVIMGQSPPGHTYNKEERGLPFFQGKIDFGEIFPVVNTWCNAPQKTAKPNDILISVRAPVGPTNICNIKACIGRGLAAIRCNDRIDYKFLFYYLTLTKKQIEKLGSGSTFSAISKSQIENHQLPLPPLPEQKKIAEILMNVDECIEKVNQLIQTTERLKKGLLDELLTKGIGHKEFKDTEIGKIPKEWEVVELSQICNIESGNTAPQKKEYFDNGKYPFIRMQHLNNLEEDKYPKLFDLINENAITDNRLKLFKKGTILLAKSGESIRTEKKAILKFDSFVVNHLAILEIKDENKIDRDYLFYFYKRFNLSTLLTQTTTPSINLSVFKKIQLPLPPLPEQKKIADILSTVDKKLELLNNKKVGFENIKKGLMEDLLTGKRRVRVGN